MGLNLAEPLVYLTAYVSGQLACIEKNVLQDSVI